MDDPLALDALFSFLHFTALLIMAGALSAEAFMLRLPPAAAQLRLLSRADAFYGGAAGLLILSGFGRVFWGAKHESYYWEEPFFWAKIATFVIVALISILPTIRFIKWTKAVKADESFTPPEAEMKSTRRIVMLQLHLIALILVFAVLMARNYGSSWLAGP